MHITPTLLRGSIDSLTRAHHELRQFWTDRVELAVFDRTAKLTLHRASAAVTLFESDPFRELDAIAAMYRACSAGLELLDLVKRTPRTPDNHQVIQHVVRDLDALVVGLFTYLVPSPGEPLLELRDGS